MGIDVAFLAVRAACALYTYLEPDSANEQTPNFAMTTADVNPTALPTEKACTAHLFLLGHAERAFLGDETLPLGSPLRVSNTPEWPPTILFDAVYAGAVLHHFGTQTLKDEVTVTWKDIYRVIVDEKSAAAKKVQKQEREARYQAHAFPDAFDMLMFLPYIKVPTNDLEAAFMEAEEKAEAMEQRRAREKVDAWMKQSSAV